MNASDITSAESLRVETIAIRDIYVLNPRTRSRRLHRELIENIRLVGLKRPVTVSRHAVGGRLGRARHRAEAHAQQEFRRACGCDRADIHSGR